MGSKLGVEMTFLKSGKVITVDVSAKRKYIIRKRTGHLEDKERKRELERSGMGEDPKNMTQKSRKERPIGLLG